MTTTKKLKGFTIIEVVLVLAIAGLIFLMVFLALPALSRNTRDTQRKQDLARLQTAVTSYTSINRGTLPTLNAAFVTQYLTPTASDSFLDPQGAVAGQASQTTYNFGNSVVLASPVVGANNNYNATTQNIIYYATGHVCDTAAGSIKAAATRNIAFRMYLESGGVYCLSL